VCLLVYRLTSTLPVAKPRKQGSKEGYNGKIGRKD